MWPDIVAASREICGWAGAYSRGYIDDEGMPDAAPTLVRTAERDEMNGMELDPPVTEAYIDSFAVFRLH